MAEHVRGHSPAERSDFIVASLGIVGLGIYVEETKFYSIRESICNVSTYQ